MSMGPGIGTLIGLQMGQQINDDEFNREKERLLREMGVQHRRMLAESAQKTALKAVVAAVVGEIAAVDSGKRTERRLSDPKNVAARGEDFIDTAEHELNRLSSGRLSFSRSTFLASKSGRVEPHDIVRRGSGDVSVEKNSSPKAPKV